MAIPKSTYVMGLVTLGLFGLAIRATAKNEDHRPSADESENEGEADDEDEGEAHYAAQEAADHAREQAEAAQELAKITGAMRSVYGAEAATPGALFAGISFDSNPELAREQQTALSAFRDLTESSVLLDSGLDGRKIDAFTIEPVLNGDSELRDKVCSKLGADLFEAWGHGTSNELANVTIWANHTTHQRASFTSGGDCKLTFEEYADVEQWITRSDASVIQLSMIGQPAAKVADLVGAEPEDGTVGWRGMGVGIGTTGTELTASIVHGKVAQVIAVTHANQQTRSEIDARLGKLLGKPVVDPDTNLETWKSRPGVSLEMSDLDDRVVITVGKAPY